MSAKGILPLYKVIDAQSMGADVVGAATDVTSVDNIGIQITYTGTPTGSFYIEGSVNGLTWVALQFAVSPVAAGVPGDDIYNIKQFPYPKIRIRYARTSGAGTLNAWILAKRLGG